MQGGPENRSRLTGGDLLALQRACAGDAGLVIVGVPVPGLLLGQLRRVPEQLLLAHRRLVHLPVDDVGPVLPAVLRPGGGGGLEHARVDQRDVVEHGLGAACPDLLPRVGVRVLQQRRRDVPARPVIVAFAAEAVVRPEPALGGLVVEDVVDPLVDLVVQVGGELAGGGVAARVQLRRERHDAIQPVGAALVPGAAVVELAADPDGLVDVRPEVVEVAGERVGLDDELVAEPARRLHAAQLRGLVEQRRQALGRSGGDAGVHAAAAVRGAVLLAAHARLEGAGRARGGALGGEVDPRLAARVGAARLEAAIDVSIDRSKRWAGPVDVCGAVGPGGRGGC